LNQTLKQAKQWLAWNLLAPVHHQVDHQLLHLLHLLVEPHLHLVLYKYTHAVKRIFSQKS
jgi:hypothetical protein